MNDNNKNEVLLKEFNNKYNLSIKDIKINKLDLSFKGLGNEGLNDLCKIEFKELKGLYLYWNNISDIKVLEKVKFDKLKILNLGGNKISKKENISIISKLNQK